MTLLHLQIPPGVSGSTLQSLVKRDRISGAVSGCSMLGVWARRVKTARKANASWVLIVKRSGLVGLAESSSLGAVAWVESSIFNGQTRLPEGSLQAR